MDTLPLFARLAGAKSVLVAGAGGGFDVLSGLPLAFALQRLGKTVHLANLTFSYLGASDARQLAPHLYEVTAETASDERYFPERHLAAHLGASIYCIEKVGVAPMREIYRSLCTHLDVDAIVLVDGGTDILMRGDEAGLGTPAEDITSLLGAETVPVPVKLVVSIGFGVDTFHGVAHADFLENVAALSREGAYHGAFSLQPDMPEVEQWLAAVAHVQARTPGRESIVCASIADAVRGQFGDHRSVPRIADATKPLFINPLMSLVWTFELGALARRCLYRSHVEHTRTIFEVSAAIEAFRKTTNVRPRRVLPM